MSMSMSKQLVIKHDTSFNWTARNPILMMGEVWYDVDRQRYKIGDGVRCWNDLPYVDLADNAEKNASVEPSEPFQTHCDCCGAPVDLDAVKCPYCGVVYRFKRGKRREARVYDDARKRESLIDGIKQMKEVMRNSKNYTAYRMGLKGMLALEEMALNSGAMSINEVRDLCGLEGV